LHQKNLVTDDPLKTSPQTYARIGGLLYLINIVAGLLGEMFVRNALVVSGDAAATAQHMLASPLLWRAGIAGDLIMQVTDVPLMLILYVLLKPVNRNIALLAMLFTLVQTAVLVANKLNLMMPLFLLADADYLKAFTPDQLHALAYLSIKAHGHGFGIGLIFFGFECLLTGYLIFKSGYLPRILGVGIQIAGLCYLINSFALILAPVFADSIFPSILVPCFFAELALCLWLLVKGVDVAKWNERLRGS
jgi:Domain of unknown function (DUF4386)